VAQEQPRRGARAEGGTRGPSARARRGRHLHRSRLSAPTFAGHNQEES
jgi:hypothetical protein